MKWRRTVGTEGLRPVETVRGFLYQSVQRRSGTYQVDRVLILGFPMDCCQYSMASSPCGGWRNTDLPGSRNFGGWIIGKEQPVDSCLLLGRSPAEAASKRKIRDPMGKSLHAEARLDAPQFERDRGNRFRKRENEERWARRRSKRASKLRPANLKREVSQHISGRL